MSSVKEKTKTKRRQQQQKNVYRVHQLGQAQRRRHLKGKQLLTPPNQRKYVLSPLKMPPPLPPSLDKH